MCIRKQMKKYASFQCERPIKMKQDYSLNNSDDRDEYPEITQYDLDRAVFRIGLKPASLFTLFPKRIDWKGMQFFSERDDFISKI